MYNVHMQSDGPRGFVVFTLPNGESRITVKIRISVGRR